MVSSVTSSSHSVPSIVQTWTFRTLPAKIFSSCTNIVVAAAAAAGLQLSPLKTLREPAVYSPESHSVPRLNLPWQQTRAHGLIRTFSYRPICTAALLRGIIFSYGADRNPHSSSCSRAETLAQCSVDTCDARERQQSVRCSSAHA